MDGPEHAAEDPRASGVVSPPDVPRRSPGRILTTTARRIWRHPSNRGHRARALAAYAGWQAWQRVVRRPVTVHLTAQRRIVCHPHSPVESAVIYYGLADLEEMSFLLHYLRPGDGFADVGANAAIYSLLATTIDEVSAIAFEPAPTAWRRARRNVALNGLGSRIDLQRRAVGAVHGDSMITTDRDARNHLVPLPADASTRGANGREVIEVVTLDDTLPGSIASKPSVVKVDVEGFEVEVLDGAVRTLSIHRPALILEVNDPGRMETRLADLGYTAVSYDPGSRSLHPTPLGDRFRANVIAVCDPEAAQRRVRSSTVRVPA